MIDTSAWILALRNDGDANVAGIVNEIIDNGNAATCAVVMLELLSGVKSERHYRSLHDDLDSLIFVPITNHVWNLAFRTGFTLRRNGVTVQTADMVIAAAAMGSECTVIHRDKHFDLISNYCGLNAQRI